MAQIKEETKIIKVMECFSLSSVRLKSRAQYGANLSCRLSVSRWPYSGHGQWTRHIYRALYACVNISVHVKHLRHWQPYCCLETGKSENRETEREGRKGVRVRITQQHRLQQHSFWQLQRVNNVFFLQQRKTILWIIISQPRNKTTINRLITCHARVVVSDGCKTTSFVTKRCDKYSSLDSRLLHFSPNLAETAKTTSCSLLPSHRELTRAPAAKDPKSDWTQLTSQPKL